MFFSSHLTVKSSFAHVWPFVTAKMGFPFSIIGPFVFHDSRANPSFLKAVKKHNFKKWITQVTPVPIVDLESENGKAAMLQLYF